MNNDGNVITSLLQILSNEALNVFEAEAEVQKAEESRAAHQQAVDALHRALHILTGDERTIDSE